MSASKVCVIIKAASQHAEILEEVFSTQIAQMVACIALTN